jgi:putative hydrolase of the HAD superfamily
MITTLFFDIGNVLVGFDHRLIWNRLATVSKLPSEEIQQRIQSSGLMDSHELGKLSPLEFFHETRDRGQLESSVSFEAFRLMWADIFWEQKPIIQLAQTLQQHYTVALLSNVGEIHWNWLVERFPIFSQVDNMILSFQVGSMKPAREIYQEAIRQSGLLPEQCGYIDDNQKNVEAGREFGIQAVHYQSPEQLKSSLRMLNIEC